MIKRLAWLACFVALVLITSLDEAEARRGAGAYAGGGGFRGGVSRGVAFRGGVYRGAAYRGVYRGGVYRGVYRGGIYRGGVWRGAYRPGRWYGYRRGYWGYPTLGAFYGGWGWGYPYYSPYAYYAAPYPAWCGSRLIRVYRHGRLVWRRVWYRC